MRELARFAGAVAVIALVALATTPGHDLSATRIVDATLVVVAAALATACGVVADLRRARPRPAPDTAQSNAAEPDPAEADATAHSPV